jgi:hypothetical protein
VACAPPESRHPVEAQSTCPDPKDTSIYGEANTYAVTLDRPGKHESQIHFKTARPHDGFHRLSWEVGVNRLTCDRGQVWVEGFNSYLLISITGNGLYGRIVPGRNYFAYKTWGCRGLESKCTELVEEGTIVVDVNNVP